MSSSKLRLSGLELGALTLESGALPVCPITAGTLIVCRAVYLSVHCPNFITLSFPFHYKCILDVNLLDICMCTYGVLVFVN